MSMGTKYMQNPPYGVKGRGTPQQGDSFDSTRFSRFERSDLTNTIPSQSVNRSMTFARFGVGLASVLSEHVLSHPYIVIRRQSQVHHNSDWYHVTPFTLFHTIFNIQRHQSVTTLWKGIGSTLMVKGIAVSTESVVSEFLPFPKEVSRHTSIKKIAGHLALKGISFLVITPFYAASLVETVQSEIASERPGVFDCLKEGFYRIMSLGAPPATRLLPVWKLFFPTVLHGMLHYIISSLARYTVILSMKTEMPDSKLPSRDSSSLLEDTQGGKQQGSAYSTFYPELVATFTGNLLADIMLYPLETILHRLCMQGTRTIIDNTDTGLGVIPIITRYEGVIDCLKSIISEEGISGLYKGFGALVLQYSMHVAVLRLTKLVLDFFSSMDNSNKPILASELALRQRQYEEKLQDRQDRDSSMRGQYSDTPNRGDHSNVSFNIDSSHATSTPYDSLTQQPRVKSMNRLQQLGGLGGGAGHTGTGSARPL